MLSFKAIESSDGAAHYFESSDDYYGDENENTIDAEASVDAGGSPSTDEDEAGLKPAGRQPGKGKRERADGEGGASEAEAATLPGEAPSPAGEATVVGKPKPSARTKGDRDKAPASKGDPSTPGAVPGERPTLEDPNATMKQVGPHKGIWLGRGAKMLGLKGRIERGDLKQILDGKLPDGHLVRKGKTHGSKDRKGIDFTFSAPKSVSIQALVNGDKRIVAAHDQAVALAISEMESFAVARRKEGGKSLRETTNNLVVATFRHELSRAQDPQLHTHSLVMNMTRRADGEWRALSNEELLRNTKVMGAFYRASLAKELRDMGYELRETKKGGWELASVSDKAIGHFSNRSKEIEKLLSARGQDRDNASTMQKQILALASRQRKKTDVDRALLRKYWHDTAREAGVRLDVVPEESFRTSITKSVEHIKDVVRTKLTGKNKRTTAADEAIEFAIAHLGERQGIFDKRELLEVAYGKASIRSDTKAVDEALVRAQESGVLVKEIPLYQTARSLNRSAADLMRDPAAAAFKGMEEYEKLTRASWVALTMHAREQTKEQAEATVDAAISRGAIVPASERFTTHEARKSEIKILSMERQGRGTVNPIAGVAELESMGIQNGLNAGQRSAVEMILTSQNRFVGIQGLAGTGKSHMMQRTIDGITAAAAQQGQARGFKIVGLAPYASQNQALEELGVKSTTVASFLVRKTEHDKLGRDTVVFLDEASVLPARDMESLMRIVEKRGARLVMIGDRKQTAAVEAGKPFAQLQDAGMAVAYLSDIQRQKDETLKAAVVHAANDQISASVSMLRSRTITVKDNPERYKTLATQYAALPETEREKTLVVAGTNDARRQINLLIRSNLGLQEAGTSVQVLTAVDMTKAELASASSYAVGNIIVPESNYKNGLAKGSQYEVVNVDATSHALTVRDNHGGQHTYDPSRYAMVGVYERESIKVAVGEEVALTRNDKVLGVRRGDRYLVVAIDDSMVRLQHRTNKGVLQLDRNEDLHMRYSYVSTVHSAQGLTADRVLIEADTRSLTANKAVYYVSISRPRHELTIYTDDQSRLDVAMGRDPKKFAALELRDSRSEAFFLKGKLDRVERAKLAAALRASLTPNTAGAATRSGAKRGRSGLTPAPK